MVATPEYYESMLEASGIDTESLTVVIVAGANRQAVAEVMDIDLNRPRESDGEDESSAYALIELPGGVVALEQTGYADPSNDALCRLTQGSRSAAVVRSNIQAHYRFGCARDGALLFDDDEFVYVESLDGVPEELRSLFALAWDDLESDVDDLPETSPVAVALAMAEIVTGLELTAADLGDLMSATRYWAPDLIYVR